MTAGQWAMSSALAFSHGANDAQKAIGVIAALLLGAGKTHSTTAPTWVIVACAVALTAGTALGGWRIIRTVGRRIYRLQPIEGLASETSSAGVILGASLIGAPTSTSQVVASSVVGIGGGRRRLRHVNWALVRNIGLAWLVTIPVTCAMAAAALTALEVGDMRKKRRWFLPETPDLIGQLRVQAAITLEGLDAFAAWAGGDAAAAQTVRDAGDESAGEALPDIEHRGDAAKRELLEQLGEAFVTPLAPEDLFALSRGIDWILDYTRDLVSESRAMSSPPDARLAEMAGFLRDAVAHIHEAVNQLGSNGDAASSAADQALQAERQLERSYYRGMAELLQVDTRNERISSRELYRRCARIGDVVVAVAERIVYAVVKES